MFYSHFYTNQIMAYIFQKIDILIGLENTIVKVQIKRNFYLNHFGVDYSYKDI